MQIKLEEVELFGLVSMLMGSLLTILGCFWDAIAGVQIAHNEGLGLGQIMWISFWSLYSFWSWTINRKWSDYQKKIHSLNKDIC